MLSRSYIIELEGKTLIDENILALSRQDRQFVETDIQFSEAATTGFT
ncbi:hypothetical protein [Oceanobacillus limi]|nr:hypothetical protein [Oceanobacillus limi]